MLSVVIVSGHLVGTSERKKNCEIKREGEEEEKL